MSAALDRLVEIMARLRNPQGGCPWDLEQDFKTIAPYTLEETYEVVEAIEQDDMKALSGELGDLLFQVVFHAQMGREAGLFDLDAIATQVADKMVERHPHVFGDGAVAVATAQAGTEQSHRQKRDANSSDAVLANWETDKAAKREAEAKAENRSVGVLDGVSTALPAATRAVKLQKRAARVGFDWTEARDILAKIKEEIGELEAEINLSGRDAMEDEMGDLLFAIVNLARRLDIDPETALRRTNRKFESRFRAMESRLAAQGRKMEGIPLPELEELWIEVKNEEKAALKKAAS